MPPKDAASMQEIFLSKEGLDRVWATMTALDVGQSEAFSPEDKEYLRIGISFIIPPRGGIEVRNFR